MQNAPGSNQPASAPSAARATAFSYLGAAGLTLLALGMRTELDPIWKDHLPFGTFFIAFLIVAQFAGFGPSLLSCVAGFLLADWFFIAPRHTLLVHGLENQLNACFYFLLCMAFSGFSLRMRRALKCEREARAAVAQLAAIIESSDDAIVGHTLEGKIVSWNGGARELYGFTGAEAIGESIDLLLPPASGEDFLALMHRVGGGESISHFETVRRRKSGALVEVSLTVSPVRNSHGAIVGVSTIARDISNWKRAERERESLVGELQEALAEVKTLSGMLPICSHCKKIRDDKGYWNQIEHYVHQHSNASFTHGICPDCADSLYGVDTRQLQGG